MIGYILMGLGAYLIADDYIEKRRAKNAKLLENGNGGSGGDNDRKPRANDKKLDRDGRIKPFPVKKQGGNHELHKEPIPPDKPNPPGGGAGDDSSGQPDATSSGGQAKGVKAKPNEGGSNESNLENGTGNDGDDVDLELSGVDESDSSKTD
jgi:hypothetical protein